LVTGVIQTTSSQRKQSAEKSTEENQQADLTREHFFITDQHDHQVEDTLHTEDTIVRRHDEEESHQQQKHKHRQLPEDKQPTPDAENTSKDHIDVQA
jgi:hypothetical protein